MIHKTTAMQVRKNLGELLNEVQYQNRSIVITKAGKEVAAIVDIEFFERIHSMKKLFDDLTLELGDTYKDIGPDIAEAEIKQALHNKR
jgi:prevent-host-death family protein